MSALRNRHPAGAPTGGQFAVGAHPEATLSLEAIAEAEGVEDPFFDVDDPYGADLGDDLDAHVLAGTAPQRLDHLDPDDLARLRHGLQNRLDFHRGELERAAAARLDRPHDPVGEDENRHAAAAAAALEHLSRVTAAGNTGVLSVDDMTPGQRAETDRMWRQAYAYAELSVGGLVLQDRDEAEEFTSYVTRRFIRDGFDDSDYSFPQLLRDFERERATRWAVKTVYPGDIDVVRAMGRPGGASTAGMKVAQAAVIERIGDQLRRSGFYVTREPAAGGGVRLCLTGGRPRSDAGSAPVQGAAA